jgi:hypothetical protein
MIYRLFIDDERDPRDVTWGKTWQENAMYRDDDWIIARNWFDVIDIAVSLGFPETISFDHDLGKDELTGYDIAKRLCEMIMDGVQIPDDFRYFVHSKNPVGAENIRAYMYNFLGHYNSVDT